MTDTARDAPSRSAAGTAHASVTRDASGGAAVRRITRIDAGVRTEADDRLAVEEPLEIRVGKDPVAVTMRTPGHDRELAAGFAWTEGIVRHPHDLERVRPCPSDTTGNVVILELGADAEHRRAPDVGRATRELYMSSSCGLCGKRSIDRIEQAADPITSDLAVPSSVIAALPDRMRAAQATFDTTGGLHAAALFDPAGELLVLREDVGRHNAVDKVIGHMLLADRLPLSRAILMVSGRSSFEIMQKAAMVGVPIVCAVSAPSSLAADFAQRMNQTLVGFLRADRMNVYAHAQRVFG